VPGGGLGEVEGGAEVDLYDALPIFFSELDGRSPTDDASVVDQNVEPPERVHALLDDIGGEPGVYFEKIHVHGVETAALVLHQIPGLIYWCNVQAGHVGAGFGETYGDALSEAARRPRYEGDPVIKTKVVENAH
jgi:hypothetical protein